MKTEPSAPANCYAPLACEHAAVPELGSSPLRAEAVARGLVRELCEQLRETRRMKADAEKETLQMWINIFSKQEAELVSYIQCVRSRMAERPPARNAEVSERGPLASENTTGETRDSLD